MLERLPGEALAVRLRDSTAFDLGQDTVVVGRVDDYDHVLMIFCRRPKHGRAADVDVLDTLFKRGPPSSRHRLNEGVQVADHHVDRRDVMCLERVSMFRKVAPGQDASVDDGMEGFDAAIQHFRKTCDVLNLLDGHALALKHGERAAGRDQVPAELMKPAAKRSNACLVVNAE